MSNSPEGEWVLVPREPTEEMVQAGESALQKRRWGRMKQMIDGKGGYDNTDKTIAEDGVEAYRAFLTASPAQPKHTDTGGEGGGANALVERLRDAMGGLQPLTGQGEDYIWRPANKAWEAMRAACDFISGEPT